MTQYFPTGQHYPFTNIPLPYDFNSLEPYISQETLAIHWGLYLQTYINNLNLALADQPQLQNMTVDQLVTIAPSLEEPLATNVGRNASGVYNHQFLFNLLTPWPDVTAGPFVERLIEEFGSVTEMLDQLAAAAIGIYGAGYAWLVADSNGDLSIITTSNQGTPLTLGLCPIINVDMWEHAYFLDHLNNRQEYLHDLTHVIHWPQAELNYLGCMGIATCNNEGCSYVFRPGAVEAQGDD